MKTLEKEIGKSNSPSILQNNTKHNFIIILVCLIFSATVSYGQKSEKLPEIPLVDHHTHIWSLNASKYILEPPFPEIKLPDDIARLLYEREKGWNKKDALAKLYTEDTFLLESNNTWIHGRAVVSARVAEIFAKPHRIKPISYGVDGSTGYIAGYFVRDTENGLRHFGQVLLSLKKDNGIWKIAAETLNFPGPLAPEEATAEQLIAHLDAAGIKRAVVLSVAYWFGSVFRKPQEDEYAKVRAENDWVAQQISRYPDRLIGFCSFNPLKDYALIELERCSKNPLFKGLKLHFGDSGVDLLNPQHVKKLREVFSAANKKRLPIVVHLWTTDKSYGARHSEIFLNQLVAAAPDIIIQVAHMAASGPGYHSDDALEVFAKAAIDNNPLMKNLYFDVASIVTNEMSKEQLELVVKRLRQLGIHRILYGTDTAGTVNDRSKGTWDWEVFRKLSLNEEEFKNIADNIAPYMR